MTKTNPARGMRDFLPADVRRREYVIGIIKKVYESYGYEPLETPAVENIETLMGKYGEEGNQLVFQILKRGEKLAESLGSLDRLGSPGSEEGASVASRTSSTSKTGQLADLALRYDLTVPLARVVADRRNELPKFFKRYQIQPVWRADRPARGRFREFFQCDVDAIGSSSMVIEAEIISAVSEILARLGFQDFTVRINHREVLRAMLDASDISAEKQIDALVALDKLDKIGRGGVMKEFSDRNIETGSGNKLLDLFADLESSGNMAAIQTITEFVGEHRGGMTGLGDLDKIIDLVGSPHVKIDASLARGLSYYTGTIIEVNVPDLAGSLGGGGRYDGLIGMFGKEQIPACGFSLGLERILVVMDERGMFPPEIADSTPADLMVTLWSDGTAAESMKLADELRVQGMRVLVYPEPDKFGKQMKYADSIHVPYVCVLGESEIAEGNVTVKNMLTGEQEIVPRNEVIDHVRRDHH